MVSYEVIHQYERYGTIWYHVRLYTNMNVTVTHGIIWSYTSIWTIRYHIVSYKVNINMVSYKVAHQYERYGTMWYHMELHHQYERYGIIWYHIKLHTNMNGTVLCGIIWSYTTIWTVRYHMVSYKVDISMNDTVS